MGRRAYAFSIVALVLACAACTTGSSSTTSGLAPGVALPMTLTSTTIVNGGAIPADYTCDGRNISPPLSWSRPPAGTQALVVLAEDPDVAGTFTHWVLYDLLSGTSLPPGVPATATLASGGKQGLNSAGTVGYTGPCPPRGATHHYVFRIVALDAPTGVAPGAKASEVAQALQGHIIASGELTATFAH